MADFLITIQVGNKKYNLSHSGETVYYSSSSKTGGTTLKGVKFKNNQLIDSDNNALNNFQIAQKLPSN